MVTMPNRETLETQIAAVLEILAKTAVAEICKIVDSRCVEIRLEMCRRQKETEAALRKKVNCLATSERGSVACHKRTVGVQVNTAGHESPACPLVAGQCQGGPLGSSSSRPSGLVVKVEEEEEEERTGSGTGSGSVATRGACYSPTQEFSVNFSVSEIDFPLWAQELSGSGSGSGSGVSLDLLPGGAVELSGRTQTRHSPTLGSSRSDSCTTDPHSRAEASQRVRINPLSASPRQPECGDPQQLVSSGIKSEHRRPCWSSGDPEPRNGGGTTHGGNAAGEEDTAWHIHTRRTGTAAGKKHTLTHHPASHEQRPNADAVLVAGWGGEEERLYLCDRCGQGFSCYQLLHSHRATQHAGERERRLSGDTHKQTKCTGSGEWNSEVDRKLEWNSEVDRKLQLELQRLQDTFSTQEDDIMEPDDSQSHTQDPHTHSSQSQEGRPGFFHQGQGGGRSLCEESVGFGDMQMELKAEQLEDEEEEDEERFLPGLRHYSTEQHPPAPDSPFVHTEASGTGRLGPGSKPPGWYSSDPTAGASASASTLPRGVWSEVGGARLEATPHSMPLQRPSTIPQSLAAPGPGPVPGPVPARLTRESAFSTVNTMPAPHTRSFPSSSSSSSFASPYSSSSSSSSFLHRRALSLSLATSTTAATPAATSSVTAMTTGTTPPSPSALPPPFGPSARLFRCPSCPKSFGRSTDLERHRRVHTGERPYGCGACGKRFSLRCNLVTHERTHSGSKPFGCRHCGKRFAQASNMKAHQRIHTGERPFHCPLCSRTFTQLSSLKTHQRLHGRHNTHTHC